MSSRTSSRPIWRCAPGPTNCSSIRSSGSASSHSGSASMPLVKGGKITADPFAHVADGAELPAEGAVLVSAVRFLENPEALFARSAKVGVIWPNSRDIDDLVPYLDRLGAVALVFPTFRDGRAYSQARLLRERYLYRGELRATGQVLRDQFVFMLRAGFDAFEVRKQADAEAFAQTVQRYSVFYQPTGDGRLTALHRRIQLRHSESAGL